jgi:hypothetical protein
MNSITTKTHATPDHLGRPRRTLRGDRNQCAACNEFFNSTTAFEAHRTTDAHGARRCLTVPEMVDRAMAINVDGFWVSKLRDGAPMDRGIIAPLPVSAGAVM